MNSVDLKEPQQTSNRKVLIGVIVAACLVAVILFCGILAFLAVMNIRQAEKQSRLANRSTDPSTLPPQQPLVVADDALFALRNVDGRALSFRTFEIACDKSALDQIFTSRGLYVEQPDLAIALIPMERLGHYSFDGKTANAALTDGGQIIGSPFTKSVKGETSIGEVTVEGKNIAEVKFATDRINKFVQTVKTYQTYRPADHKIQGVFALNGGSTLSLASVGLQTEELGCSEMYIPCKPFSYHTVGEKLNMKYGGFASQLEISRIEQLGVRTSGDQNPVAFTLKLRNGESIEATLDEQSRSFRVYAFVGIDDRGVIFIIPFKAIQTVNLK